MLAVRKSLDYSEHKGAEAVKWQEQQCRSTGAVGGVALLKVLGLAPPSQHQHIIKSFFLSVSAGQDLPVATVCVCVAEKESYC